MDKINQTTRNREGDKETQKNPINLFISNKVGDIMDKKELEYSIKAENESRRNQITRIHSPHTKLKFFNESQSANEDNRVINPG